MRTVVFVASNDSVTVDSDGRQVGGRDWVVVDDSDDVTAAAIEDGKLYPIERPEDGATLDPRAQAAFDALELEAPTSTPPPAAPAAAAPAVSDDDLRAMKADALIAHVAAYPDDRQRVHDLEMARPASEQRTTVLRATTTEGSD